MSTGKYNFNSGKEIFHRKRQNWHLLEKNGCFLSQVPLSNIRMRSNNKDFTRKNRRMRGIFVSIRQTTVSSKWPIVQSPSPAAWENIMILFLWIPSLPPLHTVFYHSYNSPLINNFNYLNRKKPNLVPKLKEAWHSCTPSFTIPNHHQCISAKLSIF